MFKWAIIGTGKIAQKFVETLACEGCGELRGVLASSASKAEHFIQELKTPGAQVNAYVDMAALLEDDEVDGVYIATPHDSHAQYARQALLAGVPVLCEKPLTVTAAQTEQLIAAAEQTNTLLMEAMWSKTLPLWQHVRQLLAEEAIGTVHQYSADMGFKMPYSAEHRLFNPALAGGILLDMGVYPLALFNWLHGSAPEQIQSTAVLAPTNVDEKTLVNLRFSEGVLGQFSLTTKSVPYNELWIYGERGHIRVSSLFWQSESLTINVDGQAGQQNFPFEFNGFEYQIREAIRCVAAGLIESPYVPHRESLSIMQQLDLIRSQIGVHYSL